MQNRDLVLGSTNPCESTKGAAMTEKVLERPLLPELLQPKEVWRIPNSKLVVCVRPIVDSPIAHASNRSVTNSAIHLQVVDGNGELISIPALDAADVGIDEIEDECEWRKTELLEKYLAGRKVNSVGMLRLRCCTDERNDRAIITFVLYTGGFMMNSRSD